MTDKARRRRLVADYRQSPPEAGVYKIVNTQTGKALLGSAANLASVRSKLEFAVKTRSGSALDWRLKQDVQKYGPEVFSLDVLEVLDVTPAMTRAEILADLATLEALWREKLEGASLY